MPMLPADIEKIQKAAAAVSQVLSSVAALAQAGQSAAALDRRASEICQDLGVAPALRGYQGFPAVLCVSLDEEVCHGLPLPDKILQEGQLLKIDFAARYMGWHADAARTLIVSEAKSSELNKLYPQQVQLIHATRAALDEAITACKVGGDLHDLGRRMEGRLQSEGFAVIRELAGHGIGRQMHESPKIPSFALKQPGMTMTEGMLMAIEPVAYLPRPALEARLDRNPEGWNMRLAKGFLSAHFEDTVLLTATGPIVLTV